LRGSFVPPAPIRELRDLTRYRKVLIQERTREANRLHKVLQDAGIKLASVASDILGISGRAMLNALVEGTTDPEVLADLARGRLRAKLPALRQALLGRFRPHHAFLAAQLLAHLDYLEEAVGTLGGEIERLLAPFAAALERLDSIPGVNQRTAEVIIAELGVDMQAFPSPAHLASWAGLCPGNNESAGKRRSGRTVKGSRWLRSLLVQVAWAASRTKGTYLASSYRRLAARRGRKRALVALGHTILVIIYHVLKKHETYQELGEDYLDRLQSKRLTHYYQKRLESLGYRVQLAEAEAATCN